MMRTTSGSKSSTRIALSKLDKVSMFPYIYSETLVIQKVQLQSARA